MKVTAKILSALAIMVFMAVPAITSANALANDVAVTVVTDAPEGEEKKACAADCKKECCAKKETCKKSEKKCCSAKKEAVKTEKKAE